MSQIAAIARNTFREAIRNRILYVILMFALILILFSGLVSHLTISSADRIIKTLGLTAINLFGVAIAVFVGVSLVYNELEKKTIYTIVSKPIGRWQFLLGKYFGLLMTVWVNILIMSVFFLASLHFNALKNDPELNIGVGQALLSSVGRTFVNIFAWNHYPLTNHILQVIAITLLEMAIITAFSVLYSSFTTPTLSMFFTVLTFMAGRMNDSIVKFADQVITEARGAAIMLPEYQAENLLATFHPPLAYWFARGAAYVVPNLEAFHRTVDQAIYEGQLSLWWGGTIAYGLIYTTGVLCLSILIFHRRNFK